MMKRPARSGDVLLRAFKAGKSNAEALAIYKKKHPHSSYSLATVNWYRNQLRKEGHEIPTERACHAAKE